MNNEEIIILQTGGLDKRYLKQDSNLGDLENVADARNNLGLVSGGTGDIWVEKTGDTMTGELVTPSQKIGDSSNYAEFKTDGELNLHGTSRVLRQAQISLGAIQAPGTNPPTLVEYGLNGAYSYSATVAQTSSTVIELSFDMDKTVAPKLIVAWASSETTGICRWKLEYLYRASGEDISTTTPDGIIYIDASPNNTVANGMVITEFTLTTPDSSDIGLWLRLTRDASHVNDTMNGLAKTIGGSLWYVSNKLGTAI